MTLFVKSKQTSVSLIQLNGFSRPWLLGIYQSS